MNTDTINGSEKHSGLLEESCELLFNISSDFISSNLNSVSNIIKTEELQNSNINENFKTIGLIKTKESSLNTLRENYYFEESVKEEEDILTRMTTQFIKENMDSKVKSEKKKPHPSKIAAIKPKQPSLMKTHRKDLENNIKAVEFSLKGKDLVEFRKIVQLNRNTNSFQDILNKFRLKLKHNMNKIFNTIKVINVN